MNSKVIIADDEELARSRLRRLLNENFPELIIVGEAADGTTAKHLIETLKPDIAFLDIEMPGETGMEVAQSATHHPFIIFITAYNQYALEAFKSLTLDYILKPITTEQLTYALEKYNKLTSIPNISHLLMQFADKLKEPHVNKFKVTFGDSIKFIPFNQILCFEADQKYTTVFTLNSFFVSDKTINELEKQLPKECFVRIHRKHIVNINFIHEVKRLFDRKMKIKLSVPFDRELIVSRGYADFIDKL